jgi:hypothetical protein
LTDVTSEQTSISFDDIPMPFLGVVLEAGFFDLQMKRIGENQHHDMGGNKGLVPVPHFGVNTSHGNFSALRDKVSKCMEQHGVPLEMCSALSAIGHAPP